MPAPARRGLQPTLASERSCRLKGPAGTNVDFTDLHAWCEVFLPGAGWVGLDPTSGLFAGESHIPLACTPEPASAAPVTGSSEECKTVFSHSMGVERIRESARVTQPYSDAQWSAIEVLGYRIDGDLAALLAFRIGAHQA